jgi:nicotinate phosphoribosyltransferase
MDSLEYGPLLESTRLSAGLDYYKPTMSQLAYEAEPNAEVTFTFHNRGEQRLVDYIDPTSLQARLDQLRQNGFSYDELDYLGGLQNSDGEAIFKTEFLDYLKDNVLPEVKVNFDEAEDDITLETTGPWALATFWETIVMSEVNEAYFEGYLKAHDLDPFAVYDEGDRRLSEKIEILKANPDIKFADFGTRRHFSLRWHKHVADRLNAEVPNNFLGSSNVELSNELGKKPIGTFAHEMPMVYAGLADARNENIRASHNKFLTAWFDYYGKESSTALTDTFGTDFFFEDFTPEQAKAWNGLRQDSGDPIEFGEKAIAYYMQNNVDPKTKTVVFSDGLDIDQIVALKEHFGDRVNVIFGWGTTLTNDLGIKALNVVMKATHVLDTLNNVEADTVKLSDNEGKHTGPVGKVALYKTVEFATNRERVGVV